MNACRSLDNFAEGLFSHFSEYPGIDYSVYRALYVCEVLTSSGWRARSASSSGSESVCIVITYPYAAYGVAGPIEDAHT